MHTRSRLHIMIELGELTLISTRASNDTSGLTVTLRTDCRDFKCVSNGTYKHSSWVWYPEYSCTWSQCYTSIVHLGLCAVAHIGSDSINTAIVSLKSVFLQQAVSARFRMSTCCEDRWFSWNRRRLYCCDCHRNRGALSFRIASMNDLFL
jgi:hypothetical protein